MRRYLSLSRSSRLRRDPAETVFNSMDGPFPFLEDSANLRESMTTSTLIPHLPSPHLKVKKVDHFYSRWSRKWKYGDTGSNITPELRPIQSNGKDDPWQQYCFVVVREIPQNGGETEMGPAKPYFTVVVKSPYLLKACKDVVGDIRGISWNIIPLELDPELLLSFLPHFQAYRDDLSVKEPDSEESYVRSAVDVLIDYLRSDYRATIANTENLTSHGEINFDLLFAILVPRSIVVTTCPVTGELEALQLVSSTQSKYVYTLICEGVDVSDSAEGFGRVRSRITIPHFSGTVKIPSLPAYPIKYHPHEDEIRRSLITRGRKWASLCGGAHHMYYEGNAASDSEGNIRVNSRVMIDRTSFKRFNPTCPSPPDWGGDSGRPVPEHIQSHHNPKWEPKYPADDELLLASPVLCGFSLSDKMWFEFNVEKLTPVVWNETAFSNLVLPSDRKTLLQSLVEAHNAELGFDDFIKGKGRGLVVNLFGPPGVGKTLTAEATSEHVKRPLYVVGTGDLGTTASVLDKELRRIFELAAAWKAIVLIDEADVFLEQRSLHDLKRNAMVAVFLRHLEYYPAILFLTTNRVQTFDAAFLSRIHIALHFQDLSMTARTQIWTNFLDKAGIKIGADGGVSEEELRKLIGRDVNGRQVKNATKTAHSLAASRGETLRYKHLSEVLDVMEQFSADFEKMKIEKS